MGFRQTGFPYMKKRNEKAIGAASIIIWTAYTEFLKAFVLEISLVLMCLFFYKVIEFPDAPVWRVQNPSEIIKNVTWGALGGLWATSRIQERKKGAPGSKPIGF